MNKFDDIIPPSRRKETIDALGVRPERIHRSRFPFVTIIIIILIIAASAGVLFYFSSAKVEVTPDTVSTAIQSSFTATQGTGSLPFVVVSASKVATQSVASNGTHEVDSAASGSITVYNTSGKEQKLVANTRFATSAGLVFTIHSPLAVPAGTSANPGSVSAVVYAAQKGSAYNVDPTSFTLPGLAGTKLSSAIYAKSSAPMTGGASGVVPTVDPSLEAQTIVQLQQALSPDLTNALTTQIPQGYLLLPGAATTTYTELAPQSASTTGMVTVREQGTVTAVVFPNSALAGAAAQSVSGLSYGNEPITIASTTGLSLAFAGGFPQADAQSVSFTLSGTANFVYTVNPTRIAAAVAGKSRASAEVALSNYQEVKSAVLVLRPFWRKTFPQDPSAITVVVENP